jgi:hypothetical protein
MKRIIFLLLIVFVVAGCGKINSGKYGSNIIDAPYSEPYSLDINIVGNGMVKISSEDETTQDTLTYPARISSSNVMTINVTASAPDYTGSGIKWSFVDWSGEVTTTNPTFQIVVSGNKAITAKFEPRIY